MKAKLIISPSSWEDWKNTLDTETKAILKHEDSPVYYPCYAVSKPNKYTKRCKHHFIYPTDIESLIQADRFAHNPDVIINEGDKCPDCDERGSLRVNDEGNIECAICGMVRSPSGRILKDGWEDDQEHSDYLSDEC